MSDTYSMAPAIVAFPPFQLDLRAGLLRRGFTPMPLRPKTFAVLKHLAKRPGELVTKLLDDVWRGVVVSEDVVRLSVGELRAALGDERAAPRFIETVPRRGYRFIARMGAAGTGRPPDTIEAGTDDSSAVDGVVVGRARERSEVAEWLRAATSGRRQIGFITGEVGIGKTTLFQLRAATSLCRIDGKPARERLARLVARFDTEDGCADLRAAQAVLRLREKRPEIRTTPEPWV